MVTINKSKIKDGLGNLPWAAELYWYLRHPDGPVAGGSSLESLKKELPGWREQAQREARKWGDSKQIAMFGMRSFWLQHLSVIGLTLAGMGQRVSLGFLPYNKFDQPVHEFDLRRQNLYIQEILELGEPLVKPVALIPSGQRIDRVRKVEDLPAGLGKDIEDLAFRDIQYIMQQERVSRSSELYDLRLERDTLAAVAALKWLSNTRPDLLIVPNGAILEYEAVHRAARYLGIATTTFEFFDMAQRTWIAHNTDAMHQDTNDLWTARKDQPITEAQRDELNGFFAARKGPKDAQRLVVRYQGIPTQGAQIIRQELELDNRPLVLLATNVIGDSLTLGRQVFSEHMTEWLEKTALYFADHPDLQLVVRIHPGELITKAPSVAEVVRKVLPELPEHIHLIPAEARVNTYDLIEAASLGLVYTTTAGLEMVMSGVPVVVAGKTHYRNRGFTLDPEDWQAYYDILNRISTELTSLSPTPAQVEQAWNYAYRYFIEFPHPFPWHLRNFASDIQHWPISRVLSDEGIEKFGKTFLYLVGEPLHW